MEPENTSPTPEAPAYKVDIGALFTRALDIFKPNFKFFVLAFLLIVAAYIAVAIVSAILGGISMLVIHLTKSAVLGKLCLAVFNVVGKLAGALMTAAVVIAFLRVIRGGEGRFEDLYEFLKDKAVLTQVLIYGGVVFAIGFATIVLSAIPLIGMLFIVLGSLVSVAFSLLTAFSVPLIVDKKMEAIPAIKFSAQQILRNPVMTILFLIIAGIVGFLGVIALGVGVVVTMPFAAIAVLCLYEVIFSGGMPAAPALPAAPPAPEPPQTPAE